MTDSNYEKPVDSIAEEIQRSTQTETAPPATRRYRTLLFQFLLLLALGIFALLTFAIKTAPSFPIDLQITNAIQSIASPFFGELMWLVSWPGFFPQSILVVLLLAFLLYLYGLYWESLISLLAALASSLTNELVKEIIQRPRPAEDLVDVYTVLKSYSFPSGHVMFYVILFGFVWYLAYTLFKSSLQRGLLLGLLGGLILLVGISRIYLGQHWASDVLGAYLLGGLMLSGTIFLYQWGKTRFFVHQPVASPASDKED